MIRERGFEKLKQASRLVTPLVLGSVLMGLAGTVVAAPKGSLFVSSEKDDAVYVLDGATLSQLAKIETSERPRALVLDRGKGLLYAACGEGDAIDVIDVTTDKVVKSLDVGDDPDRPTWESVAAITGGGYLNLPATDSPELISAIGRLLG